MRIEERGIGMGIASERDATIYPERAKDEVTKHYPTYVKLKDEGDIRSY